MAAEHVFYGENGTGVGGDIQSTTARASWMVGACGMGPERITLNGGFATEDEHAATRRSIEERFERIGATIVNRTGGGGPFHHDPIAGVLSDRDKRRLATQIVGRAYVEAYNLMRENKESVGRIADTLVLRKEVYGNDLVGLLDSAKLRRPALDFAREETWPTL
jgi:ATP-dependent Zn protease